VLPFGGRRAASNPEEDDDMTEYLFIESRSPAESGRLAQSYAVAGDLVARGDKVTVFLVQNAVLAARRGAASGGLDVVLGAGVEVLADDFSLRERGIAADTLAARIAPAPLETVIDRLARGAKTLWN
jgi:predicted peroxiredoxin